MGLCDVDPADTIEPGRDDAIDDPYMTRSGRRVNGDDSVRTRDDPDQDARPMSLRADGPEPELLDPLDVLGA